MPADVGFATSERNVPFALALMSDRRICQESATDLRAARRSPVWPAAVQGLGRPLRQRSGRIFLPAFHAPHITEERRRLLCQSHDALHGLALTPGTTQATKDNAQSQ
jgi:hypothetical protein